MTRIAWPLQRLYHTLYPFRRPLVLAIYGGVAAVSYALTYLLHFDLVWPTAYTEVFWTTLPILIGLRVLCAAVFRLGSERWRYASISDLVRLVGAAASGSALFWLILKGASIEPRVLSSVVLLDGLLTLYLIASLWLLYRLGYEWIRQQREAGAGAARRVLILGAGESGHLIAREMLRSPSRYDVVGFVDDDPVKHGARLLGRAVFGPTSALPTLAVRNRCDELVIAMPSASPVELGRVVDACKEANRPFKVLPGISAVIEGGVSLSHLREVRIEDLLGRDPIKLELPELADDLAGRSVLVTGAAGSIGSELSRQVAVHRPGILVLVDQAETDLFFLELELRDRFPGLRIVPIVGDIVDEPTLRRTFETYAPERVFHAAAYKHVPMMETNAAEAIRNNVIGTWRVAEAAGREGAKTFVLVSTDKAVRPANVMGATKRLAEMIVLELQERYPETAYGAVRFGNVLGSNGSVLPIFKRQLANGEPLTVTHPEATRYFMTIPEAVQLILQASLLPELRGNIAMLDMGEPVRITDLARNLLRLSGVRGAPEERIVFTGLRPGEKLHEELAAPDEQMLQTVVPKVFILKSSPTGRNVCPLVPEWDLRLAADPGSAQHRILSEFFPDLRTLAPEPITLSGTHRDFSERTEPLPAVTARRA